MTHKEKIKHLMTLKQPVNVTKKDLAKYNQINKDKNIINTLSNNRKLASNIY